MDGERRAAYAPGLSLFIGSWARLPRSLRGEPGVGKTGIVEGFAQLLAEGKLPEALGRPAVRRVDTFVRHAMGGKSGETCATGLFRFIGMWARFPCSLRWGVTRDFGKAEVA